MQRIHQHNLINKSEWDIIIIGGGATGLGTALDHFEPLMEKLVAIRQTVNKF